jgi:RimJ/RimL family protein N-acetyltransferase
MPSLPIGAGRMWRATCSMFRSAGKNAPWRCSSGPDARQGEVGWIFDPQYHGQGYATEAANAILDLAFGPGDIHRVAARCDVRNESSWRLMERLGMRREAHFREHALFKSQWDEEFIYALLWQEWRALRTEQKPL